MYEIDKSYINSSGKDGCVIVLYLISSEIEEVEEVLRLLSTARIKMQTSIAVQHQDA